MDALNSRQWWDNVHKTQKYNSKHEKHFCEWVRKLPCFLCEKGDWDFDKGEWHNTISHIKTKGSGGELIGNVLSMCIQCHSQFENSKRKNELKKQHKMPDQAWALYSWYVKIYWDPNAV